MQGKKKFNIDISKVCTALFKRGEFDFICRIRDKVHEKQKEALQILTSNEYEEFLYGGAAGGSKSWTGCVWLLFMCLAFSETRYFIGREELKRIKDTTIQTFFKVCKMYGIKESEYNFNKNDNYILFRNGSRIDLIELKYLPRDPLFERFGSGEFTAGWIEEGGEVCRSAYEKINTRIGRQYNDKYNIKAMLFITCNPKKNWLYTDFYKPDTLGELEDYKKFVQAFVTDNPFIESGYINKLKRIKDIATRKRLFGGEWEYEDNPYKLCSWDNILQIWKNSHIVEKYKNSLYYITADIARFGSDSARIGVWKGWELIDIISFEYSALPKLEAVIEALRSKYQIPASHCIADEDGVGGGVVDHTGIKGFRNNAKPYKEEISDGMNGVPDYENVQTQCLFKLAEKINNNEIYISANVSDKDEELINEELATIESDPKNTKKLALIKKAQIKQNIGRSPDFRDMMLMRCAFEYEESKQVTFKII